MLEEVHEVCTRAIIIADGRIVADETPAALEARSRYHHAVACASRRPTDSRRRAARSRLLADVAEVEPDARDLRLTAVPKRGRERLDRGERADHQEQWDVPELHLESGRLDEVFRT